MRYKYISQKLENIITTLKEKEKRETEIKIENIMELN